MASEERGISFLVRLATYRYLDMDKVIGEALDFADVFAEAFQSEESKLPVFSHDEAF